MNLKDIFDLCLNVTSRLNSRNKLAKNFELFYKNKKILLNNLFLINLIMISFMTFSLLLLLNENYLNLLIKNENLVIVIISTTRILSAIPLSYFICRLISFGYYFTSPIKNEKKAIFSEELKDKYKLTIVAYKKFKWFRLKCYFIETILPVSTVIISVALLYNFSLIDLTISLIYMILISDYIGKHFETYHAVSFNVNNIYDELPHDKIIDSEVLLISDKNVYINMKNYTIIFYDNKYIELKQHNSIFNNKYLNVFVTYLKEYIILLKEYKESELCKNKNEVDEVINNCIIAIEEISKI